MTADQLTRAVVAVDQRARRRLALDAHARPRIRRARREAPGIAGNRADVVRRLTAQAGLDLHLGHGRGVGGRQAGLLERLAAEGADAVERDARRARWHPSWRPPGLRPRRGRRVARSDGVCAIRPSHSATAPRGPVPRWSDAERAAVASAGGPPDSRGRSSAGRGASRRRDRRSCRRRRRDRGATRRPRSRARISSAGRPGATNASPVPRGVPVNGRQRLPVHLPARRPRQRRQLHDGGRHHVVGQLALQGLPERLRERRVTGRVRSGGPPSRLTT